MLVGATLTGSTIGVTGVPSPSQIPLSMAGATRAMFSITERAASVTTFEPRYSDTRRGGTT